MDQKRSAICASLAIATLSASCQGRWIDEPAGDTCAEAQADPARTPLRRLTRAQYENVVRDIFGAGVSVAFAPDEQVGAFANNATNPLGQTQAREYMDAADELAIEVAPRFAELGGCASEDEACAESFIDRIGRRLYRRPLAVEERTGYLALYREFAEPTPAEGARVVVTAMMQSPHFLYHLELDDTVTPGTVAPLPAFALASRLSFFLWNSGPDDVLLDAAATGDLDRAESLLAHVERMLEDDRAKDAIASFHEQWLGLSRLGGATRDTALYPGFGEETIAAMREETIDFVDYVYRYGDSSFRTLLTAPFSFPRGPVAEMLGVPASNGEPVALDPLERSGLLTQPSFLTAHSHVAQSSPVLRGRALRERFFCQPLGDPPPNVDATPPEVDPTLTTRERYAQHRDDPSCASCHRMIDDLGFALENYDAIGRYRASENDLPIDATGVLVDTDIDGRVDGATGLGARMAESAQARECLSAQWFQFATARAPSRDERCFIESAGRTLEGERGLEAMLIAIAMSRSLTHHVAPEPDVTPFGGGAP